MLQILTIIMMIPEFLMIFFISSMLNHREPMPVYNPILITARSIALKGGEKRLELAEEVLLDYLQAYPQDTHAWLLLAMIEWTPPLEDFDRIITWTKNILSYDPTNVYALLLLAEVYQAFRGGVTDEIYEQLCKAQTNDRHLMAMVEVAKSYYFEVTGNQQELEKALRRSIEYGPHHVTNHRELGHLLIKQGKIEEGEKLIRKAEENGKKFGSHDEDDPTSIMDFLNTYYAGL